jgi:hypothetical protein
MFSVGEMSRYAFSMNRSVHTFVGQIEKQHKSKNKCNFILILAGMRSSRFFYKSCRFVYQLKTFIIFIPGAYRTKKKRIDQISPIMIESAYKVIIFAVCPNFPSSCVIAPIFFSENLQDHNEQNKKKNYAYPSFQS